MKRAIVLLAAWLLTACTSFASHQPERYFILEATSAGTAAAAASAAPALASVVVAPTTAASFYDTQDIVYSRSPGTRAYYRYNHWTERPQRAVHAQLLARLGSAAAADRPVLTTRLEELYHDAADPPGTARITLSVELVDPGSRAVIARERFTGMAPAASYDAAGAVDGMRQALGTLLDDVAAWVGAHATPPA